MTDRINALVVTLKHDIRDDDIEPLISAIKMLHWVADVEPHVAELQDMMAEARAKDAFLDMLYDTLYVIGRTRNKAKLQRLLKEMREHPEGVR